MKKKSTDVKDWEISWILSWIFKCVAVAVAVSVAAATATAANKIWIFICWEFLRIIIFDIFTENSKSGCDLKI